MLAVRGGGDPLCGPGHLHGDLNNFILATREGDVTVIGSEAAGLFVGRSANPAGFGSCAVRMLRLSSTGWLRIPLSAPHGTGC